MTVFSKWLMLGLISVSEFGFSEMFETVKQRVGEPYAEMSGTVEYKLPKQNILVIRTERYGALTRLKVNADSVIRINGRPSALHHLFINDQIVSVRFNQKTNELREMEIFRMKSEQSNSELIRRSHR